MGLELSDIETGIRDSNIHGMAWTPREVPVWEGRALSAIEVLVGSEEILFAQATWHGNQEDAAAHVLVITESLIIEVVAPNSRGDKCETVAHARRDVVRISVETSVGLGKPNAPGRVKLRLGMPNKRILDVPRSGDVTYVSTQDLVPLARSFAVGLKA